MNCIWQVLFDCSPLTLSTVVEIENISLHVIPTQRSVIIAVCDGPLQPRLLHVGVSTNDHPIGASTIFFLQRRELCLGLDMKSNFYCSHVVSPLPFPPSRASPMFGCVLVLYLCVRGRLDLPEFESEDGGDQSKMPQVC